MKLDIPYKAVKRQEKLADQVFDQLRELIAAGDLQTGESLPSERELAEYFNVSRTVVREAIRSLLARGLVEAHPGGRAVVSVPDPGVVAESVSFLLKLSGTGLPYSKVFEIRKILEPEIAALAAERASEEDIWDLQAQLKSMELGRSPLHVAEADVEFHAVLARATKNELFPLLLDSLASIMVEIRKTSLALPGSQENAIQHHRRILERVQAHEPEAARRAMELHLQDGKKKMEEALGNA